jgi:hypothetical protein
LDSNVGLANCPANKDLHESEVYTLLNTQFLARSSPRVLLCDNTSSLEDGIMLGEKHANLGAVLLASRSENLMSVSIFPNLPVSFLVKTRLEPLLLNFPRSGATPI